MVFLHTILEVKFQWLATMDITHDLEGSGNRACFVPRVNSFAIKSFFYTGVKLWNSLPYTTQIITNRQAFKSEVKKLLWLKLIQTIEDIFLFY